jgi:hypothetical protein
VKDVSGKDAEPNRGVDRRLSTRSHEYHVLAGIRVLFEHQAVSVLFDETPALVVQGFEMIPGPRYLRAATV